MPRRYDVRRSILLLPLAVSLVTWAASSLKPWLGHDKEVSGVFAFGDTVRAPDFPAGLEWLNTDRPLSLSALRGKVVLLDFWTYCCINCMHVIPDLKRLEAKYGDALVVIGVHSAKFAGEKDTDNIRQAILRYEIGHPVVNDRDMVVWSLYGVRAWPTAVLIDPTGKIVETRPGEAVYEAFDQGIARLISEFEGKGLVSREPLNLVLERERAPEGVLSFPGKVLADGSSGRLFIADSNHNRILVAGLATSAVTHVIGSGEVGLVDGPFAQVHLNHPQGMAFDGESLYIADTENHAIRKANLTSGQLTTIAGTGRQASFVRSGRIGAKPDLSSPWDVTLVQGKLYVAMAGVHQLWVLDLQTGGIGPYAGSGAEGRLDGPLMSAALAQPSGLTSDGRRLYFADSESSSIRYADLDASGRVGTIVGLDLFEFGDRDGVGDKVRLQHPLGVVSHRGVVYVADTYNNKIKRIDPNTRRAETVFGSHQAGYRDGAQALFDEPGGISAAGDLLYIADTNNDAIRVADLVTGEVTTVELTGLGALQAERPSAAPRAKVVRPARQVVAPGAASLVVRLVLPEGYALTPGAPSKVTAFSDNTNVADFGQGLDRATAQVEEPTLSIPLSLSEGKATLTLELSVYYCRGGPQGLCFFKDVRVLVPLAVEAEARRKNVSVEHRVPG